MAQAEPRRQERVAIIGISGRFPGAADVDEFWDNLKSGRESLRPIAPEGSAARRQGSVADGNGTLIRQAMALYGGELFDAGFFGYTNAQACRIDPQQRLFLEAAWHALEHAGYDVERYQGTIGVFAGVSRSTYANLRETDRGDIQAAIDGGLGSIANRVSYKLNLNGPSVCVDTACSTSLIAVHLAIQSLLSHDCDMVLAGGASIRLPQAGYVYHRNGILSPDGHCRAFDANARGTVPGNGIGIVVLKRLADALADRDRVYGVILGSAVNNDGGHKVGYTAPSLEAQVALVRQALERAGVNAQSIGMLEGHGTGTVIGDEIELTALTEVMAGDSGAASGKCALGSVKANIGHLDVAAGVAGLIKALLCLSEKTLVPTINCESPSPLLRSPESHFYINRMLAKWEAGRWPRRAGVSSFGIGGSNAHVVLEEFEPPARAAHEDRILIFPVSARTAGGLNSARAALRRYLTLHADLAVADVAFTLQMGRACFEHRFCGVAASREQLLRTLSDDMRVRSAAGVDATDDKSLILQFNGDDSRELGSLRPLYVSEPAFAAIVNECLESVAYTSVTLDELLKDRADAATLQELRKRQLVRLLREYCLARLWLRYGVEPAGVIGFGTGQLAAACVAGVMDIGAACRLCIAAAASEDGERATRAIVRAGATEVLNYAGLGVSVWHAPQPGMSEILGSAKRVAAVCRILANRGIAHSPPDITGEIGNALENELQTCVERITLSPATIPYLSVVDGRVTEYREVDSIEYWRGACEQEAVAGDRQPIEPAQIALLVEPRKLAREENGQFVAAAKVYGPLLDSSEAVDRRMLLKLLADLWEAGAPIDWNGMSLSPDGSRIALPVYPFERTRHWIDTASSELASSPNEQGGAEPHAPEVGAELESTIASVWAEALGVSSIELDDRFLDIGGDSLVGIRIAEQIESLFGVDLPLDELIRSDTTVRRVAGLISNRLAS
jgi:acyl transferase domain-containing protein